MKKIFVLIIISLVLISSTKKEDYDVRYQVTLTTDNSIPSLKVKTVFKADPDGHTYLFFQDKAWGENSLYNCLSKLKLVNAHGKITKNADSNRIEIKHSKKLKYLEFEYILTQDTKLPLDADKTYRPVIQKEYFSVFSHNLFMLPEHLDKKNDNLIHIKIDWEDFPKNYTIHNSFGSNQKTQKLDINRDEFHSGIFIGGDYKIYPIEIQKNKVYLATRGDWVSLNDIRIVELLKKTISVQRNFWKDHSQKYFTVTMQPFPMENGSSFLGTGLTNSFATAISNNSYTHIQQLAHIFNHELLHNWIGHTIKKANEEEQYWFSEGFTDYYTIKNIASNNILELDEAFFIEEFNTIVKNLFGSPVREAPNSEINYENFWSDRDYEKLPYRRGALFAFYLDYRIRRKTNNELSLDHLMREFLKDAVEKKQKINHPYFIKKVNHFLQEDISSFFEKHIENGVLMDLEAIYKEFDFEFTSIAAVFYRGYTLDSSNGLISDVDRNSNAFKAGMRDGDKAISVSVYSDPKKEAEFTLLRGKEKLSIKFFPAKEITAPQLINNEKNRKKLQF